MAHFEERVAKIIDMWARKGTAQERIVELWVFLAKNNAIAKRRNEIFATIHEYWESTIKGIYQYPSNSVLTFSDANFEGSVRRTLQRWKSGKNVPDPKQPSNLASFVTTLCCLILYRHEIVEFARIEPPVDDLAQYCCDLLEIHNDYVMDKIKTTGEYLAPVLFTVLHHALNIDREDKAYDCKAWIHQRLDMLNRKDPDIRFVQSYYETLWETAKRLELRDIVDGFWEFGDVCDLYVYPNFKRNGETQQSPVAGETDFRRMVQANSGMGKSSLLQTIIVTNILSDLKDFGSEVLSEVNPSRMEAYEKLRAKLSFAKRYFPVYLIAADYNKNFSENGGILDYAAGVQQDDAKRFRELVDQANRDGRLLLLIDALDEIENKPRFCEQLSGFLEEFGHARLLITCRPIDLGFKRHYTMFQRMEFWELETFDDDRVKQLAKNWLSNNATDRVQNYDEEIVQRFLGNRYLQQLTRNPYMFCQALYQISISHHAQPNEILSHLIDRLIEKRWPESLERYEERQGMKAAQMRKVLSCLAWSMVETGEKEIAAAELVQRLAEASREVGKEIPPDVLDTLMREMNVRAGLLVPTTNGYAFQLQMIGDYLAAEWLLHHIMLDNFYEKNQQVDRSEVVKKWEELLPDRPLDGTWKEIITMFFAITGRNLRYRTFTISLYDVLVKRLAKSLDEVETVLITDLFLDLLDKTFGANQLTNPGNHDIRAQMVKQIANMRINIERSRLTPYQDELGQLASRNLIRHDGY